MFDISLGEMLVVAVVTVVVVGPEELPKVLRTGMRYLRSLKSLAAEVQRSIETLAEDETIVEVKQSLRAERRYIIDEAGNYQEVFDIADLMARDKEENTDGKS